MISGFLVTQSGHQLARVMETVQEGPWWQHKGCHTHVPEGREWGSLLGGPCSTALARTA